MRHIGSEPVRTHRLIFTLLGDYLHPREASVATSGLVGVLGALGASEGAVRSALSRMKARGWLRAERQGRRSRYRLTARGVNLLEEGDQRIFGARPNHWNGQWHVIIYSLPSQKRTERRRLRTRLAWLGYGMLVPGTMIAPRGRPQQVRERSEELGIQRYVHSFDRARLRGWSDEELVARCWDLDALDRSYADFIARHLPQLERREGRRKNGHPEEVFTRRFWMTYEFSGFPRRDPFLPPELLPSNWKGDEAAIMFSAYRERTRGPAQAYVDAHLGLRRRGKVRAAETDGIRRQGRIVANGSHVGPRKWAQLTERGSQGVGHRLERSDS